MSRASRAEEISIMRPRRTSALAVTVLLTCASANVQARQEDLASLDLADLMQMDVTISSAARRAQAGGDAAAAVFVLTSEDIRRSGAHSIPELLRVVPGVQVARVTNQVWMVTARGFSSRFANKLLVLVDGRSIYTHNFSGVMWEDQHVPLEEIERIEVVRGPGGALWGANAVNGIINIITRGATEAGGLAGAIRASADERTAALHYGGELGQLGHHRTYVEGIERESFDENLSPWKRLQAGWRFDSSHLRLRGDVYENNQSQQRFVDLLPAFDVKGGAVSASWQDEIFTAGLVDLQSYYSWTQYSERGGASLARESASGFDFQISAPRMGRHLLTMGGGYRKLRDDVAGLAALGTTYLWPRATQDLWNIYVQDELYFLEDDLRVTLGAKLEGFKYTGDALQPTLRAIWHFTDEHALWAAVSTAVRTPARFDLHGYTPFATIPGIPAVQVALAGNPAAKVEHLQAYETGWRWRPTQRLSFDLTLFEHRYRDLLQALPASPYFDMASMTVIQPYSYVNDLDIRTRGAELAIDWRMLQRVRVQGGGAWFHMNRIRAPHALTGPERSDAERQFTLGARVDLLPNAEIDLGWRWVAERAAWDIPSYDSLNINLAWRAMKHVELAFAVENLLNERHIEFYDERGQMPGAMLERSASIKLKWNLGKQ
jgi:iron complex outermembrane recepter protein